ncbi:hypothetical protein CFC21_045011 [Triticum aestivum]|uniref:Lipoxygenase n=2 Tax=Triticum aestivum TaxID=4565 RepID=A0A9R1FTM9_WHEAT|nr:probable linoleate 9S-lipoxygenase 4 isoform X1 [Triticum aestivum]KAF7033947.1 hypothetical protein CFC21_045011 [Triticum aestivum]
MLRSTLPLHRVTAKNKEAWRKEASKKKVRILGRAVLVKSDVLDLGDFHSSLLDGAQKLLDKDDGICFHLVSATLPDPSKGNRGWVGRPAHLQEMVVTNKSTAAGESVFTVTFDSDESQGIPGAVIVRNSHRSEFLLKTLTIDSVPGKRTVVFVANSWIYPNDDRVFFANDTYLPSKMPAPLVQYRRNELINLQGDGTEREYKEHDRVYRYDYYNDLGEPGRGEMYARPILGGSQELPYPRRGRTGRGPTKTDPRSESRIPQYKVMNIYVPRDERIGHLKLSDFLGYSLKAITDAVLPIIRTYVDSTPKEFDSFQDIYDLYDGLLKLPINQHSKELKNKIPLHFIKSVLPSVGDDFLNLPLPHVIKSDPYAWKSDEEFAREMLAGMNPVCIRRLTEFPVKSTLDPSVYGDQSSTITEDQIQQNLEGLTVTQAMESNRLFILDHHDNFMPFLDRINKLEGNFIYASRTLLFLKADGTLKPLAIELSLPHPDGLQHGAESRVYVPADERVDGQIWQLAKAYACVNDSAWHQLISHWLNTHAVMEPFVIATNRQLSVVHPVHKLLSPHYRDTMNINAMARTVLINAGGLFELTVFPGKYALEMSSVVYKKWKLTEQGLPDDLVKRGMAVRDPSSPYGIRLLLKDYPYAVDGLAIWWAIQQWVKEYLGIYYPNDCVLQADKELKEWWKEVREVGHGDLKDEDWWPKMETVEELAKTCITIIWVASALHASVNFGQYQYAGYLPNRPTVSRQKMPVPGTEEYTQLERGDEEADRVFIHTISQYLQSILGLTLIQTLSKHSSDEVYLGQRDTPEWTSDAKALELFERFGTQLVEIEERITAMNKDPALKNRNGPVNMPYMLLYPNTSDLTGDRACGLTGMGIPNSVSI